MGEMGRTLLRAFCTLLVVPAAWAGGGNPAVRDEAADRACAERTVAAVQARYEAIHDLSARFEQTTRSVALGGPGAETTSRGTVVFAKPGKMRWEYTEPEPSLVVSDGSTLTVYDPTHKEAQRLSVSEGYLSGAAIEFLLGEGDILTSFDVNVLRCEDDAVELELVPKQPATYEKLAIRVDPATATVVRTSMIDLLGNETVVAFSGIETNRPPDPGTFVFDPPEGVRVIDLPPAGKGEG
jgi:outer membrane lipoprotein carrier protein